MDAINVEACFELVATLALRDAVGLAGIVDDGYGRAVAAGLVSYRQYKDLGGPTEENRTCLEVAVC